MKSEKSFLSLGIIALVLFLGVGYAVVSSVYLNIGGTASVNDQDLNVEITNAVASTNIADKTGPVDSAIYKEIPNSIYIIKYLFLLLCKKRVKKSIQML